MLCATQIFGCIAEQNASGSLGCHFKWVELCNQNEEYEEVEKSDLIGEEWGDVPALSTASLILE